MKTQAMLFTFMFTLALVTACSPTGEGAATAPGTTSAPAPTASTGPETAPASAQPPATTASATGVVEAVNPEAGTITIAHGPVDVLKWPAMTMTFAAPNADLTSIRQGDRIAFEFTATGMHGTITRIRRQ